ncbi:MAG: phosphoglycerate dehydrogenase, partial [Negativicutes bacterium]
MKVLAADGVSPRGIEILREAGFTVDVKDKLTAEELLATIGEYDALIVRSASKVTKDVLDAGKKLKIIGRAGVGVD